MVVLHRATASEPWAVFPGQLVTAGNVTNGSGYITFDNMRKGQYAFGKALGPIGIDEAGDAPMTLELFPDPVSDVLTVSGQFDGPARLWWDVLGADGRFVQRTTTTTGGTFRQQLDVSALASGTYILRVRDAQGTLQLDRRFHVVH